MMPVWNQSTPPKDPNHVFNLHGPGKTGRDLWLSKNFAGSFTGDGNSEYVIDPGHPDAADYTINVLKHVAAHYDVDGIHMDLIRYMGTDWGYNPTSVDRFNQRYGRTGLPDPNDETWKAWRREQVNHLVEKAYANLLAVKPNLVVSAATIAWGNGPKTIDEYKASLTMNSALQDWNRWLETGAIDLAIPMNYFREYDPTQKQYYENWLAWEKDHQYKRRISAGVGLYLNSIPDGLTQIRKARQPSVSGNKLAGVHLYSYAVTNKDGVPNSEFYAALSEPSPYDNQTPVLAEQVAPPVLPWKAQPITGHLTGKVLYSNGTISDNETVTIRGPESRTVQTDGSGDYSAIDLKPGTYTITCGKISKTVSITAGKVTQANLTD